MGWKHTALSAVRRVGGLRLLGGHYGRDRLTVLAYHRVIDAFVPGFAGYRGNVSATPDEFATQMQWIAERMNPVSLEAVAASLEGAALPERPVLVTFDDGYRDNLDEAQPILQAHDVPAAVFLATDHIGTAIPFWWDLVAWAFDRTDLEAADLPLLGVASWEPGRPPVRQWIDQAKTVQDGQKHDAVAALRDVLAVPDPTADFAAMLLSWDQVREMSDTGWSIGAHTCTHPILTRLAPAAAALEVRGSIDRVRSEIGEPVLGFAYPNGQPGDFDDASLAAVGQAGVPLGFTLAPGPTRRGELLADPLAVRRVYVHHGDDETRFAAKLAGVPRLMGRS